MARQNNRFGQALDPFWRITYLRKPMAILELVKAPDPRLKSISQPVAEFDRQLRRFMDDMVDTMYSANGIGLAAIQVGIAKRVAVIDLDPKGPKSKVIYLVNP